MPTHFPVDIIELIVGKSPFETSAVESLKKTNSGAGTPLLPSVVT
jgi:hypothetical protein